MVEFFREASLLPGFQPFTPSQYISLLLITTGTIVMLFKSGNIGYLRKKKDS